MRTISGCGGEGESRVKPRADVGANIKGAEVLIRQRVHSSSDLPVECTRERERGWGEEQEKTRYLRDFSQF